jgi:hypothetical protein
MYEFLPDVAVAERIGANTNFERLQLESSKNQRGRGAMSANVFIANLKRKYKRHKTPAGMQRSA